MANAVKRILDETKILAAKNTIIMCYPNLPAQADRVNLNHFFPQYPKGEKTAQDSGLRNLGDNIAPELVEFMLNKKGLSLQSSTQGKRHLYTIGSIVFMGHQDATVWGSGILTAPSAFRRLLHSKYLRKLDIRCVRGPLTKQNLEKIGHKCPQVYGDPGCLLPLLYKPEVEKTLDYVVIPHVSMEKDVRQMIPGENIVSMATQDYKAVADKICSAKKVIASSLHGIIFAEAYGIPTVFYQDRGDKYNFKYVDWYEGSGRKQWITATELMQAIQAEPMAAPDLSAMQQRLIESFPYDLWGK